MAKHEHKAIRVVHRLVAQTPVAAQKEFETNQNFEECFPKAGSGDGMQEDGKGRPRRAVGSTTAARRLRRRLSGDNDRALHGSREVFGGSGTMYRDRKERDLKVRWDDRPRHSLEYHVAR